MKTKITVPFLFILTGCLMNTFAVCASGKTDKNKKPAICVLPASSTCNPMDPGPMPATDFSNLSGPVAYAENLWSMKLYSINVANPSMVNIIAAADYKAFCSDFFPGDTLNMWIINYLDNSIRTVNIATGLTTYISAFPCPLTGGVWSCLSIHKTTSNFYAIATDGAQSLLCHVEPGSGTILSSINLNIEAAISSTFDYSGDLFFFDIASDSVFTVNVATGTVSAIGYAGFNGNYAQGMGFDPVGDEIYLSAFAEPGGPQLRRLNRITGNTLYLANLPGSTCAFSFPVKYFAPFAFAGCDTLIDETQVLTFTNDSVAHQSALSWTTQGDGYFNNISGLHPTYHPGATDILNRHVQLCLTAWPQAPGMDSAVDCMTLMISPMPSGLDFGDAPETGEFFSYPTTLAMNGAAHVINPAIFLGDHIDGELDGQPDSIAAGDDAVHPYTSFYDDEDGVLLPASAAPGTMITAIVKASVNGYLDAWMDFDLDHTWLSPDEQIFSTMPVSAGTNSLAFLLPVTAMPGQSFLRFRFHTDNYPLSFDGIANDGEVEDYAMVITGQGVQGWDFGDAPDGSYPSLLASNGARHQVDWTTFLGIGIDAEPDGLQSSLATGDDLNNLDDEDGVSFPDSILCGSLTAIEVVASVGGYLQGWIDYNQNGNWSDPGEQVFTNTWLDAGVNSLSMDIPLTASTGFTFGRFRFGSQANLPFTGAAENGEVEDYRIKIYASSSTDTICAGTSVTLSPGTFDGIPPFTFSWTSIPAGWVSGEMNPVVYPEKSTVFRATITDSQGRVNSFSRQIVVAPCDFGDAPDNGYNAFYQTLLQNDGARHFLDMNIRLGNYIDAESNGIQDSLATGDDLTGVPDDEDGITQNGSKLFCLVPGPNDIEIVVSSPGYLNGWIDTDFNQLWDAYSEHVFDNLPVTSGFYNLDVPLGTFPGYTYARFRFTQEPLMPAFPYGLGGKGEVEDYWVRIDTTLTILQAGISITASANPVVAGTSVTFTATPVNGGSMPAYQWVVNGVNVGSNNSVYMYVPFHGDAICCMLVSNSACTGSSPVTSDTIYMVTIPAVLNLQNIIIGNWQTECYNATNTITVAGGGQSFVVESGGSVTLIAGQKISLLPGATIQTGAYLHGFIAPSGPFCSLQKTTQFTTTPDGGSTSPWTVINDDHLMKVYPNPTSGEFKLEITGADENDEISAEVYSMFGERLYSRELKGGKTYSISITGKPNGIYFLRVVSEGMAGTLKIIKQ